MRTLLLALVAVLLAVDGYVHGLWTGRWQTTHELEEAARRLENVPMVIGDWQGKANTLPARTIELAGFTNYLLRTYQSRQNASEIQVLLACGAPGPLSVHTPEACFGGAGYDPQPETREVLAPKVTGPSAEVWKAKFVKNRPGLAQEKLRVLYAWHAHGTWQAPDQPRWTFAGLPVIHKLYVTRSLKSSKEADDDKVCADFLQVFLPELDRALFSAP